MHPINVASKLITGDESLATFSFDANEWFMPEVNVPEVTRQHLLEGEGFSTDCADEIFLRRMFQLLVGRQ